MLFYFFIIITINIVSAAAVPVTKKPNQHASLSALSSKSVTISKISKCATPLGSKSPNIYIRKGGSLASSVSSLQMQNMPSTGSSQKPITVAVLPVTSASQALSTQTLNGGPSHVGRLTLEKKMGVNQPNRFANILKSVYIGPISSEVQKAQKSRSSPSTTKTNVSSDNKACTSASSMFTSVSNYPTVSQLHAAEILSQLSEAPLSQNVVDSSPNTVLNIVLPSSSQIVSSDSSLKSHSPKIENETKISGSLVDAVSQPSQPFSPPPPLLISSATCQAAHHSVSPPLTAGDSCQSPPVLIQQCPVKTSKPSLGSQPAFIISKYVQWLVCHIFYSFY